MKVIAYLPARGSSERIENKNVRLLDGKPLFLHTLEKLTACSFIDQVYLDSESEAIFDLASETPCHFLKREASLASNATDGNALFRNEVQHADADIYIQILCTSPFIEKETIKKGIEILKKDDAYDSAVLIRKEKLYTWDNRTLRPEYDMEQIPNSFTLEDTIIETMGLYIVKRDAALKTGRRIGERPYLLEAKPIEAVDVNVPEDFELADLIAGGKREKERKLLSNLAQQLTSSIISDVLDELDIKNKVIRDLSLNLPGKKLFGRAKTLKIKKKDTDEQSSIYDALDSYRTVVPGDIIVVENEMPEYAYFGELNALLAMRSGAIGAVIGGATRDSNEVKQLDFPVLSTGRSCRDIKHRGTLESINKKIFVGGVDVGYEDLVFADNDGVVVIPKAFEEAVLEKCFSLSEKESSILIDIAKGADVKELLTKYGFF